MIEELENINDKDYYFYSLFSIILLRKSFDIMLFVRMMCLIE